MSVTAGSGEPRVWAVDTGHLPLYWFPRIELRAVPNLWLLWGRVVSSTVEFSGIRLRNAEPRPAAETV